MVVNHDVGKSVCGQRVVAGSRLGIEQRNDAEGLQIEVFERTQVKRQHPHHRSVFGTADDPGHANRALDALSTEEQR